MTRGFLEEITAALRVELASGGYARGVGAAPAGPRPSLRAAVQGGRRGGTLLVEYKRASPGRDPPELPRRTVAEFVRSTDLPEVAGYSCLATRPGFDGAPAQVAELAASTPRPVLYKEFVLGSTQVRVAAATGASAVLLIARLERAGLLDQPLETLAGEAHALGLEVLLELHAPEELDLVGATKPDLVGVNVRDLDTLKFERARALATLRKAHAAGIAPLVGLSGVDGPAEAGPFWEAGCDALLVGSAVALARDPAAFLRSLCRGGGVP